MNCFIPLGFLFFFLYRLLLSTPFLRTLYLATLPVLCARWMAIECQQSSESQENYRILLSLTLVFFDAVTSAAKVLFPEPDSRMDTPEGKAGVIDHMKYRFSCC